MGAELSEPFIMMFAKAVIKFIFLVWIFIFSLVVGIEVSSERQSSLSKKLASEIFLWGNCLPIMKNETQSSLRRYTTSVPHEASEKQQCLLQAAGTKGGQWATQSDGLLNDYPCSYYMRQHKATGFLGSSSALSCWCFSRHLHGLLGWEVAQKTWANPGAHEGDMVTCLFVPVSLQRMRGKHRIRYPHHWCGYRPCGTDIDVILEALSPNCSVSVPQPLWRQRIHPPLTGAFHKCIFGFLCVLINTDLGRGLNKTLH